MIKVYTIHNERDLSGYQTYKLPKKKGRVLDISFYEGLNFIVTIF